LDKKDTLAYLLVASEVPAYRVLDQQMEMRTRIAKIEDILSAREISVCEVY